MGNAFYKYMRTQRAHRLGRDPESSLPRQLRVALAFPHAQKPPANQEPRQPSEWILLILCRLLSSCFQQAQHLGLQEFIRILNLRLLLLERQESLEQQTEIEDPNEFL